MRRRGNGPLLEPGELIAGPQQGHGCGKLARIVWAVWRRDETFHAQPRLIAAA